MIDWTHIGTPDTHRYRSYYDAGAKSTTRCALSRHPIRYCYALHDKRERTFVIGSCCFHYYEGTKTHVQLEAAKVLQEALRSAITHDSKLYGTLSDVREIRKEWIKARREALKILRQYRSAKGDWLPRPLFELKEITQRQPRRDYKMQKAALRWYQNQLSELVAQTKKVYQGVPLS